MHHRRTTNAAVAALTTIVLGAALVACGGDDAGHDGSHAPGESQTAGNGDIFNDADVRFATEMIPHHAQAIEMVTLTQGRPLDPEVRELAEAIRNAQAPEVETMADWLTAWDVGVPATSLDHANAGHDMEGMEGMDGMEETGGSGEMPGMMSEADMTALADAPDDEFQDLWLEMMIEHHTGAITMAEAEQADGVFDGAISLAGSIEDTQREEIDRMRALLGS